MTETPTIAKASTPQTDGGVCCACVVGPQGLVQAVTGDGRALLGLPDGELTGRSLEALLPGRKAVLKGVFDALAGQRSQATERFEGVQVDLRCEPIRAQPGAPVTGCLLTFAEVREASPVDRTVPTNGHRWRLLFRQIPGAVWATDTALCITDSVGRLKEETSLLDASIVGCTVPELAEAVHADPEMVVRHISALTGKRHCFRYDFAGRTYDIGLEPLRDQDQAIIGCIGVGIDVTERLATEEQLQRSEERLAEAQRAAHVGSWEWNVERNEVTWSDELFRIYGVPKDQFRGSYEGFLSLVYPEDAELTKSVIFDAFRHVKPFTYDHRIVRPDGAVRMLHTRGDVVTDAQGKVERMVGSCWDITDFWNASREVEQTVSLLRATLDSTADGLLVVDRKGKVQAVNHRFLSLWKAPPELLKQGDDEALLNVAMEELEDPVGFRQRVEQLYRQPEAESLDTLRFKDGRIFERFSLPQRVGNEIVGRVWSFRDVTQKENLLRSTMLLADASRLLASLDIEPALEAMAHLILPAMGEGCAVDIFKNAKGPRRVLSISHAPNTSIAFELPRAVLQGHSLIYMDGGASCLSVPLVAQGEVLGAMTFTAQRSRKYTDADLKLAEELARRVELAIANAQLYRKASEALRAREEFLSIAAHELRGPMTALRLAVQRLRMGQLTAQSSQLAMEIIEREVRRIARFVDEILDVSRARNDRILFDFEEVDLAEVTRDVVARHSAELARSGSTLSVTAASSVVGLWDRARIDQVVTNLLLNAIKFGQGRPIEVAVSTSHGEAKLVVRDTGMGIDPERQRDIFEPFERAVSGRHFGGLGLGLYIVRSIAEGLGGTVSLESQPERGTTVTVELPQVRGS